MTDNAVALFKGAGLPATDLGQFKKALSQARQVAAVGSNVPFLRMLKQTGDWVYGANETEVQEGSRWAVNPLSLEIGFVCWNPKGGAPLGKRMVSIFQPPIIKTDLPDLGGEWDENVKFQLMCLNGEDKGTTVEYTANSYGGRKAFDDLMAALQAQLDKDPANIVPVILLENDSYKHNQYGLIWNPIFNIVDWMPMNGGTTAPAVEPQAPTEQEQPARPRRAAADAPAQQTAQPAAEPAAARQEPAAEPVQRQRRRRAAAS